MRIAIAGAGNVGRSIAQELIGNGHQVMLIERQPRQLRPERVPEAEWVLADACEVSSLEEADVAGCDVVVAATGDDKANLVVSLLAKTEFAVGRVVARVNRAENEWLFNEQWGVDVAVSKPRLMAALVEEAVTVGDLVRLMTFRQGEANLVEITLPETAPFVGHPVRDVPLPRDSALVAILRGKRVLVLGIGNSATDLAVESSRIGEKTFLAMRRGAYILPKYMNGKPTDESASAWLTRLPLSVQRFFIGRMFQITAGDMTAYGLPKPDMYAV